MANLKKRGQITAFVLLGLVILVLVGFMMYAARTGREAPLKKSAEEITSILRTEPIQNYVEMCIKDLTINLLRSIGSKGGYVLNQPGGREVGGNLVSYWITKRTDQENIQDKDYPAVQDSNYAVVKSGKKFETEESMLEYNLTEYDSRLTEIDTEQLVNEKLYPFGDLSIPALCQKNGPNDRDSIYTPRCPQGSYGDDSIQEELTKYLTQAAGSCIKDKEEEIKKIGGYTTLNIKTETPKVVVIIGETDITVNVEYAVEVGIEKAVKTILSYNVNVPVRLKQVYGLAKDIAKLDRTQLSFDVLEEKHINKSIYKQGKYKDESVKVLCPSCNRKTSIEPDDLIEIVDKGSSINGAPFHFWFARKNRRPVLSWIHQFEESGNNKLKNKNKLFHSGNFEADYIFKIGEKIEFEATAYDPDEDGLFFSIEDNGKLKGQFSNEGNCIQKEIGAYQTKDQLINCMRGGLHYKNFLTLPHLRLISTPLPEKTIRIENSDPAKEVNEKVFGVKFTGSRRLESSDFGYHKIIVKVCDDEDHSNPNALCDSQDVVILVVDEIN